MLKAWFKMGKPIDVAPYYFISLVFMMASLPSLSQAISCTGSAKYKLTFKGEWTAKSHPQDFPSNNPHFSSVVGCTHNASYVMWRPGVNATRGVQDVAETGGTGEINKEMDQQISLKTALHKFQGKGISNVGTRTVDNIAVNSQYPLVSAISMIAPSPDWFVGVRDYSLCNETTGKWVDKRVRSLPLYDSGTDSALKFVHSNTPTVPHVPIFLLDNTHDGSLKSNETTKPFGTFTFEKTSDSNQPPPSSMILASITMVPTAGKASLVPTEKSSMVSTGKASTKNGMTQANMTSSVTHSRGTTQSSTKSAACSFVYQSISVSLKLIISGMLTIYFH